MDDAARSQEHRSPPGSAQGARSGGTKNRAKRVPTARLQESTEEVPVGGGGQPRVPPKDPEGQVGEDPVQPTTEAVWPRVSIRGPGMDGR